MNGDLNGNDLGKVTRRSPKDNGESGHESKKIKLDDPATKYKNEVRVDRFVNSCAMFFMAQNFMVKLYV